MNRLILERFGKKFIDSFRFTAKQLFIKNNPDEIFSYEQCDNISRYPNSTTDNQFEKLQTDYLKNFLLPKDIVQKRKSFIPILQLLLLLLKTDKLRIYQ